MSTGFFKKIPDLAQKQVAVLLIALGLAIFFAVALIFPFSSGTAFPELLPSKNVVAYIEFPVALDDATRASNTIREKFGVDWNKDILTWADKTGALVLVKREKGEALPVLFLQTESTQKALDFLTGYRNQQKVIEEKLLRGAHLFSTPALHFVFIPLSGSEHSAIAIAESREGLEEVFGKPVGIGQALRSDNSFTTIRTALHTLPYFAFARPNEVSTEMYMELGQYVPSMPQAALPFPALGVGATFRENAWHGKSYALFEKNLPPFEERGYRALLLPLIPPDFNVLISGQNLPLQLLKLESMSSSTRVWIAALKKLFTEEYLPGTDFEKDLAPLLSREFAVSIDNARILFVTHLQEHDAEKIAALRTAFMKIVSRLTPAEKEMTLPDGTRAAQLVPDASVLSPFETSFEGIPIHGVLLGQKNGLYEAVAQDKWFISTDIILLKKALLLTKEPGRSVRTSELYRASLQPILKNPELIGVSVTSLGTFSFSKRTFASHMETNFVFVLE